jgi:hypothetical protein
MTAINTESHYKTIKRINARSKTICPAKKRSGKPMESRFELMPHYF